MSKSKPDKKSASKAPTSIAPSVSQIMDALPDPVVAFDSLLKVCFSNHAAQVFFKCGEAQMLNRFMVELLGSQNDVFDALETAVRNNQSITLRSVHIRDRPGNSVTISTVEPGALYLLVIRQQMMQLTQEWNEQIRLTLKSTEMMAQMLTRDIKQPLSGIRDAAQGLHQADLSVENKERAGSIVRDAARIQEAVDRCDSLCEVPRSQHQNINLREVLNQVARLAQAEYGAGIKIEESFDPSLPDIRGHFDHLVQAQLNLIKNAAEALPDKNGKISIRTFYDAAAGPHPVCVEIEDNGRGITPEMINRIFQPYVTTKPNSQGLGLPIVSRIVDAHGGIIHVDSKTGKTVFRINFPMPAGPEKR